ncbi:MAG: tetraacyldisaccharide 4'-kinase [Gammaproteobacteria bacterium]|nr:tetraacyldisaccharide 4'-kinase [Gammaproteobacteria bacterium]
MKSLDHYWYDRNLIAFLLWPVSLLFRLLVWARLKAYQLGVFKSFKAAKPVIIIGNIAVGGTGKTPLILELCRILSSCGLKVGVISRGYGGTGPWPHQLYEGAEAEASGDEPVQLFQRTKLPVVVGPDRVEDANLLCKQNEIDIILADDGLQHYRLQRDLELVVIDQQRQFGNGFCLPAGPLREPLSRLNRQSWCIYNGGEQKYSFTIEPSYVKQLGSDCTEKLSAFTRTTVHAVAGIGNPDRFFNMLKDHGIKVIEHPFADHYQFSESDLNFADDLPVLMTEKDSVKCKSLVNNNLWYVTIDIKLTEQFLNDFKKQVVQLTHG